MQPLRTPSLRARTLIQPASTKARVGCWGTSEDRWFNCPTSGSVYNMISNCSKYAARVVLAESFGPSTELPKRRSPSNKSAMPSTTNTPREKFSAKSKYCASSPSCATTCSRPRSTISWRLGSTSWPKWLKEIPNGPEIQPWAKVDSTSLCQNRPWQSNSN